MVVQVEREEGQGWWWKRAKRSEMFEMRELIDERSKRGERPLRWGKERIDRENGENRRPEWWERTGEIKGKKIIKKWLFN